MLVLRLSAIQRYTWKINHFQNIIPLKIKIYWLLLIFLTIMQYGIRHTILEAQKTQTN